jgi:uncharacterized membrane protein
VSETEQVPVRTLWSTSRVEAFSDAVFAIAITLLVLEISIDPSEYDHLAHALAHEWPAYLAYATSFLTVGSVWIAHHSLFSRLRYIDPVLLRINMMLLLAAAFLPFPTSVLAQALHASDQAERVAIAFYGATALVIELLLQAGVRYAASQPDLLSGSGEGPPLLPVPRRKRDARTWLSSVVYGAAIVFGIFLFPRASAIAYLAVAVRGVFVVGDAGRLGPHLPHPHRRQH